MDNQKLIIGAVVVLGLVALGVGFPEVADFVTSLVGSAPATEVAPVI